MVTIDKLYNDAITHWKDNRGIGTALIPPPLNDMTIILGVLERIYNKHPDYNTLIVVKSFKERGVIIEYLTTQEDENNNEEFKKLIREKKLRIYTENFVLDKDIDVCPNLVVLYHIVAPFGRVQNVLVNTKFKLVVLNKVSSYPEDMASLYRICPLLNDFKQTEVDEVRINTPVEDMWVSVPMIDNSEEDELLKYYNEYISTSLNIFGSFDIMQQARIGNNTLNISANTICNNIAYENGWNEHLDMSVQLNVKLDELYNPNAIRDRATMTYELIRNRSQLLSDYKGKLEAILKIVQDNPKDKFLIINKRGEFANKVTEYINNNSESNICANYHDKVEPIPAIDFNGKPIYYKSGAKKGERRMLGATAQGTLNQHLFNVGDIRVLSTNNAPNKDLSVNIDAIIITSPLCEDIKSFIYRLSNVRYPNYKIKLYSIYVKDTLEETKLQNKIVSETHTIVNKCENDVICENNSDFVVID